MDLYDAIDLMKAAKAFEDAGSPYEQAEAASALASQVRSYIEDEAELGGWFSELEEAIGEAEPTQGNDEAELGKDMEEAAPTGAYERDGDLFVGEWRVHLIHEGERYGATDSLVYGDEIQSWDGKHVNDCQKYGHGLPLVEFYHISEKSPEEGQFVSRYYMSTLLGMDDPLESIGDMQAFGLEGSVPDWTLRGDDLKEVYGFLCEEREAQAMAERFREETAPQSHDATRAAGVSLKGIVKEVRTSAQALSENEGILPYSLKDAVEETRSTFTEDDKKKAGNNGNTDNPGYDR